MFSWMSGVQELRCSWVERELRGSLPFECAREGGSLRIAFLAGSIAPVSSKTLGGFDGTKEACAASRFQI